MSGKKRSFSKKARNKHDRKEKPLVIITAEGRNETEAKYFNGFRTAECPYIIKYHKSGNVTDPTKLAASIRKRWEDEDADIRTGDKAFVVVDLDNKDGKAKEIHRLENENNIEEYIVSNPSFEVWYLLHYDYSTHSFINADAAIRELRKHHKGYEKNSDMYPLLEDKLSKAIANAEKLEDYYSEEEHAHPDVHCNPYTDVHNLVKLLKN